MTKELITINLDSGLEATLAAMLVQVASKYDSTVYVQSEDGAIKVNAKSIMGMMSLGLSNGMKLVISADGKDEKEAGSDIRQYLGGKEDRES